MKKNFLLLILVFSFFGNVNAATLDGTTSIVYTNIHNVFNNGQSATGFVKMDNGFTIRYNATANINITEAVSGPLDLRTSGIMVLEGDLYLDSNVTLSSGGYIYGNGNTIFLGGDLEIPNATDLRFTSSTIIDGQGHNLILGHRAQLLVDTFTTLTLKNLIIKNTFNTQARPAIRCLDWKAKLALDNVEFALNDDFYFNNGQMFIYNDVAFTNTSEFIYTSVLPSYITPHSTLYFDKDTSFKYYPSSSDKTLIKMQDESSDIYFDGCSLKSTFTGLQLTTGNVYFDNKVNVISNQSIDISSTPFEASVGSAATDTGPKSVSWSPDGKFMSVVNYTSNSLQIFSFAGNGNPSLVGSASTDTDPQSVSFSPDGRFISVVNATSNSLQIFSFAGNGNPSLVGSAATGTNPFSGNWSPDGKFISVTNEDTDKLQVFSFSGSGNPSFVGDATTHLSPRSASWSPDGKFISVVNYGFDSLQVFSFSGSGNPSLVGNATTGTSPKLVSWSPDGRFLSVVNEAANRLQLFSFSGSGNPLFVGLETTGSVSFPQSASWSPDGRFISVANWGTSSLSVFSFSGSGKPSLVGSASTGSSPRSAMWSPDGKFISVVNEGPKTLQVFKVNYINSSQTQAPSNSIVFQDLQNGIEPDASVHVLGGAQIILDGLMHL